MIYTALLTTLLVSARLLTVTVAALLIVSQLLAWATVPASCV